MTTAVVICPGRGTYNKAELGYLGQHFPDADMLASFDVLRENAGQTTLTELDSAARYSSARHSRGDNASGLIYAATLGDFLSIDRDRIEIVAVTGNSMGWYSALACAGAVSANAGFNLANTMGTLMQAAMIGGQLIYPFVGEDWHVDPARKADLMAQVHEINAQADHVLALSIDLGGMLVLAGNEAGLSAFEAAVPRTQDRFPMRLPNHAAFHTGLQSDIAKQGRDQIDTTGFGQPAIPMIDGRGAIWWPGATNTGALWEYTLGHQVTETYDFTRAVSVAAREFAPDLFIITGPGSTLGGAFAQSLILAEWRGMRSKQDFQKRQQRLPLLVSMGMESQRSTVI